MIGYIRTSWFMIGIYNIFHSLLSISWPGVTSSASIHLSEVGRATLYWIRQLSFWSRRLWDILVDLPPTVDFATRHFWIEYALISETADGTIERRKLLMRAPGYTAYAVALGHKSWIPGWRPSYTTQKVLCGPEIASPNHIWQLKYISNIYGITSIFYGKQVSVYRKQVWDNQY